MSNNVNELTRISQYFNLQTFLVENPLIKLLVNYCMLELSIMVTLASPTRDSFWVERTKNFKGKKSSIDSARCLMLHAAFFFFFQDSIVFFLQLVMGDTLCDRKSNILKLKELSLVLLSTTQLPSHPKGLVAQASDYASGVSHNCNL